MMITPEMFENYFACVGLGQSSLTKFSDIYRLTKTLSSGHPAAGLYYRNGNNLALIHSGGGTLSIDSGFITIQSETDRVKDILSNYGD
jgi:hypothetical protein